MNIDYEYHESDVLVIGGGLAGTNSACHVKKTDPNLRTILVDKGTVGRSGASVFAAGVYNVVFPGDDFDDYLEEFVYRGEFLNDQRWVERYLNRNYGVAMQMVGWGEADGKTVLERDERGEFVRRKSRGHIKSTHCVLHPLETMQTMRDQCEAMGVLIRDRIMIYDLLMVEGRVCGALGFSVREGTVHVFLARATVICSAGSGFKSVFVGHRNLTGDLQAAAFRAGAQLVGMEKTHANTGSAAHDIHGLNLFVGSGGRFINGNGSEFMEDYDILGSRARLQDLAIALSREVDEGRGPIYMDMRKVGLADQELMRRVLPETFRTWDAAGVKPFESPVEWIVSWAGSRTAGGGVRINERCETSLPGLFAAGDLTDEPVHGTYAFGGVNVAFAAVSGAVSGEEAARTVSSAPGTPSRKGVGDMVGNSVENMLAPLRRKSGSDPRDVVEKTLKVMVQDVGFLKEKGKIVQGLSELENAKDMADDVAAGDFHELMIALESQSQPLFGSLMLESALIREESRGFHFRLEYPYSDNENWLRWVVVQQGDKGPKFSTEEIPQLFYEPTTARHRAPGTTQAEAQEYGLSSAAARRVAEPAVRGGGVHD